MPAQSDVHVGRVLHFIATFTAQRPEGHQDAADAFVEVGTHGKPTLCQQHGPPPSGPAENAHECT